MSLALTAAGLVAKAVIGKASGEIAGSQFKSAKKRMVGSDEERAFAKALLAAYDSNPATTAMVWAQQGVDLATFQYEGAEELSRIIRHDMPDVVTLAGALVDSLSPELGFDERWTRIEALEPSLPPFLARLYDELSKFESTRSLLGDRPGATESELTEYLRWAAGYFRNIDTAGIGTIARLDLPLSDAYVPVRGRSRIDTRSRWASEITTQIEDLEARRDRAGISAEEFEVALDRLQAVAPDTVGANEDEEADVDLRDHLQGVDRTVVIGEPGSGKSTFARYITLLHARAMLGDRKATEQVGTPHLPIYVSVGEFARSGADSLREFLGEWPETHEYAGPLLEDAFKRAMATIPVLLVLDGLDEVGSAEARAVPVKAITDLMASVSSQVKVVVTTRPAGYEAHPLPASFVHVTVTEMDEATIELFLSNYLRAAISTITPTKTPGQVDVEAGAATASILSAASASPGVRRLTSNPLLLVALVLVHQSSGALPASRIDAYEQIEGALVETWRAIPQEADGARPSLIDTRRCLRTLARWMHEHRPERSASRRDLITALGPVWGPEQGLDWTPDILAAGDPSDTSVGRAVSDIVRRIEQHSGLLVERAPGRWGFPHLTFQEYYVARSFLQDELRINRPSVMRQHLHREQYEEPLRLALALIGKGADSEADVAHEFRAVVFGDGPVGAALDLHATEDEAFLHRDALFALAALSDDISLARPHVEEILRPMVDDLINDRGMNQLPGGGAPLRRGLASLRQTLHQTIAIELTRPLLPAQPTTDLCARLHEASLLPDEWPEPLDLLADQEGASPMAIRLALTTATRPAPATLQTIENRILGEDDAPIFSAVLLHGLSNAGFLTPEMAHRVEAADAFIRLTEPMAMVVETFGRLEESPLSSTYVRRSSDPTLAPRTRVAMARIIADLGPLPQQTNLLLCRDLNASTGGSTLDRLDAAYKRSGTNPEQYVDRLRAIALAPDALRFTGPRVLTAFLDLATPDPEFVTAAVRYVEAMETSDLKNECRLAEQLLAVESATGAVQAVVLERTTRAFLPPPWASDGPSEDDDVAEYFKDQALSFPILALTNGLLDTTHVEALLEELRPPFGPLAGSLLTQLSQSGLLTPAFLEASLIWVLDPSMEVKTVRILLALLSNAEALDADTLDALAERFLRPPSDDFDAWDLHTDLLTCLAPDQRLTISQDIALGDLGGPGLLAAARQTMADALARDPQALTAHRDLLASTAALDPSSPEAQSLARILEVATNRR